MDFGIIILVAIGVMVLLGVRLITQWSKKQLQQDEYPYQKRDDALFTAAERSFLGSLIQVVGDHAHVFGKVRVADVITTQKEMTASERQTAHNKISSKHFDFLLCDKNKFSVLCAIELNDSSHRSAKRRDRDKFLGQACQSADVPLISITAKRSYNMNEIRQLVEPYIANV